ncbi:MAG: CBS domain-containing protein [Dehalococcoidia bacterium]|nr:CBS domain-containing protein [Dehalococcoidia bacterium]
MLVRDIMTSNLITVSSDTLMVEAGKIMEFHRIERLPVVDKGKLVGLVTKDILDKAAPSEATSLSRWELRHLLGKMQVKEIMKTNVVTISPDTTVECAIATAQGSRVGSLPVVDKDRVVGIVTTNDFFYRILNPLMGIGEGGSRIIVYGAGDAEQMLKVTQCLSKNGVKVKAMCTVVPPDAERNDLLVHLDKEDASQVVAELKKLGFSVDTRAFWPC